MTSHEPLVYNVDATHWYGRRFE